TGAVAPIDLEFDVRNQEIVSLLVDPETQALGGSFNGARASLQLRSVSNHVDLNSRDNTSLKTIIYAVTRAFSVPDQTLDSCLSSS
ncbi:hypothetical protein ABTM81_20065, partial [Acinetobacter baumannii]